MHCAVPSGGDWSVHRGAAVEIVDSTNITVAGCTFDQVCRTVLVRLFAVVKLCVREVVFVHAQIVDVLSRATWMLSFLFLDR